MELESRFTSETFWAFLTFEHILNVMNIIHMFVYITQKFGLKITTADIFIFEWTIECFFVSMSVGDMFIQVGS